MSSFLIRFLILSVLVLRAVADDQLISVFIFQRHGIRLSMHPLILSKEDDRHDLADITNNGMAQIYALGLLIKDQYTQFVSGKCHRNVTFNTLDRNRNIVSLFSVTTGFFEGHPPITLDNHTDFSIKPPIDDFDIDTDLGEIALPRGFFPIDFNSFNDSDIYSLEQFQKCESANNPTTDFDEAFRLFEHVGLSLNKTKYNSFDLYAKQSHSFETIKMTCDLLLSDYFNHSTTDIDKNLVNDCAMVTTYNFSIKMAHNKKLYQNHVNRYIIRLLSQKTLPDFHFSILSDNLLYIILSNFLTDNHECMEWSAYQRDYYTSNYFSSINNISRCMDKLLFSSNITIEVYQNIKSLEKYIKLKINNHYVRIGENAQASFDDFIKILSDNTISDFEEQCNPSNQQNKYYTTHFIILSIITLLNFAILLLIVYKNIRAKIKIEQPTKIDTATDTSMNRDIASTDNHVM